LAHKYGNFAAAFAVHQTDWTAAIAKWGYVGNYCPQIRSAADSGSWKDALYKCSYALWNVYTVFEQLNDFYGGAADQSARMESLYWAAQEPAGAEITFDAVINVMLTANPDQIKYFVGLLDAYRQSIWNKPYNQEFFAALARGFMEWG